MTPELQFDFPANWTASILAQPPMIAPHRRYVYPQEVEDVERGALFVEVRSPKSGTFLAVCALGFADPVVPSGLWSSPHPDWLCAAAGGYVYMIDTTRPRTFEQIPYRPVLEVQTFVEEGLLLFASHHAVMAWGRDGLAWQTGRLSWEGLRLDRVAEGKLHGFGWDLMADREVPFTVDLQTGEHQGGSAPQ